jgi:hypothetical protein
MPRPAKTRQTQRTEPTAVGAQRTLRRMTSDDCFAGRGMTLAGIDSATR